MSGTLARWPFRFVTGVQLTQITPHRAKNLSAFLEGVREAPESVIYYHTHHFLKQHQYLSPEPPNDFAHWVLIALQNEALAEKLASIDTVRYRTLRELRDKIVRTLEIYLLNHPFSDRQVPPEQAFRFLQSVSFVLPTPYLASNLDEFVEALKKVSINSLYHHIFEAKIRLSRGVNDFANWFETSLGEADLARAVAKMDPYTQTLEGLRKKIIGLVEKRIQETSLAAAG